MFLGVVLYKRDLLVAVIFSVPLDEQAASSELSGVAMSPAARRRMDTGFKSIESQQLVDYLCKTQQAQLDLLCVRVRESRGGEREELSQSDKKCRSFFI